MEKLEIQEYNLNIKLDGVVNIIGLPASGKTYLLKKIINKIPSIDIFIDGQNIKNLPLDYLQKNIAVVFNDNKFNTEYAEEELIYYQDKLGISRDLSTEKIKNIAKYFNIEELLVSKINLLKENEKILIKILSLLIINPSILGIDNLLTYLTIENKMKLLKYAKENNITILSVTNNKEELLLGNYILIIDNYKVADYGKTEILLKDEKLLSKYGMKMPFIIELSSGLNYYDLLKNDYSDEKTLIGEIWK